MPRLLEPDELLPARRFQNSEILLGDLTRCDAVESAPEKVDRHIEMWRLLEQIDGEELAPEMIEGELRARTIRIKSSRL